MKKFNKRCKSLISLILALAVALTLAGCKKEEEAKPTADQDSAVNATVDADESDDSSTATTWACEEGILVVQDIDGSAQFYNNGGEPNGCILTRSGENVELNMGSGNVVSGEMDGEGAFVLRNEGMELSFTRVGISSDVPDVQDLSSSFWSNDTMDLFLYPDETVEMSVNGQTVTGTYYIDGCVVFLEVDSLPMIAACSSDTMYLQGQELSRVIASSDLTAEDLGLDGLLELELPNAAINYPTDTLTLEIVGDRQARLVAEDGANLVIRFGENVGGSLPQEEINTLVSNTVNEVILETQLDISAISMVDQLQEGIDGHLELAFTAETESGDAAGYAFGLLWYNPMADEYYAYAAAIISSPEYSVDHQSMFYEVVTSAHDLKQP